MVEYVRPSSPAQAEPGALALHYRRTICEFFAVLPPANRIRRGAGAAVKVRP